MYDALVRRDPMYEGTFIVGVKTTGIFCRPTCNARKPKFENVEFFDSVKEAIKNGYRACKVCNPLSRKGDQPEWLPGLINEIESQPAKKWKDYELDAAGFSPSKVRRYFKKAYDMTFHEHLRMSRINHAFLKIREGVSVTHQTAFASGYESLSGFNDSYKKLTGYSPTKSIQMITVNRIPTPLGTMMVGVVDQGLCLLEFTDRRMLERQLSILEQKMSAKMITGGIQ